jgi:hypothetical protein
MDSHSKKIFNYEPLLENKIKHTRKPVTNHSGVKKVNNNFNHHRHKVETNQVRQGTSLNSYVDMSSYIMNQSKHESSARSSEINLVFENVNRPGMPEVLD